MKSGEKKAKIKGLCPNKRTCGYEDINKGGDIWNRKHYGQKTDTN